MDVSRNVRTKENHRTNRKKLFKNMSFEPVSDIAKATFKRIPYTMVIKKKDQLTGGTVNVQ